MHAVSHQPKFSQYPLATLAASFACGILFARFVNVSVVVLVGVGVCLIFAVTFSVWRISHDEDNSTQRTVATNLIVVACVWFGATALTFEKINVARDRVRVFFDEGNIESGDPVEITGVLERAPEIAPDGFYFNVRVEALTYKDEDKSASGAVQYFIGVHEASERALFESLQLKRGARVRVMARVKREDEFRNPGVASFKDFLDARDVDASATLKSALLIERLADASLPFYKTPLVWLDSWRANLIIHIDRLFKPETAGVLKAVLLKNRYGLSREVSERYRAGGTFHLLVIAGLHISFIGGIAYFLVRRVTKNRAWQFIASAGFLWTYAVMVGLDKPITRAALMFTFVALAPVVARRGKPLNALGAATLVLLIARPSDLFDAAFQLTVASVLSIVVISVPLLEKMQAIGAWHLTRATPYPPRAPRVWITFCEALFWSERAWRKELERTIYSYKLFKTPHAAKLERWHAQKILRYVFAAIIISASVQIGILPFLVVYFHRVSFASLLLNTFAGALMAFSSLVAVIALIFSSINHTLAAPFAWLVERSVWLTTHSVDVFDYLHFAQIRLPYYAHKLAVVYVLYFAPLAVLSIALARVSPLRLETVESFFLNKTTLRVASFSFVVLFAIIIFHPFSAPRGDGRLHVDFLDVGQGDSALVTLPDGATLLIDAGGRRQIINQSPNTNFDNVTSDDKPTADDWASDFDEEERAPFERDGRGIGEAVVSEFLWHRGLDKVDYILATHAHADHMDGLNDITRNFQVSSAFIARAPSKDATYQKFAATMAREHTPVNLIARGDTLHFGEVTIDVLSPPRGDKDAPSGNNESVVLLVHYGARKFLLTGDAERGAESAMLDDATKSNDASDASTVLHSDVVKVGHHGSRTSSTAPFVAAVHPQLAIISVGLHSIFGHPHKEILERWQASGARVLVTGKSGTISVSTDGNDLQLETYAR